MYILNVKILFFPQHKTYLFSCSYKIDHPKLELEPKDVPNCSRNIVEQCDVDLEINPMKENNDINIIENDRIHRLIHGTFSLMDDKFDDVHDIPFYDKAEKTLHEGSTKNVMSNILLFVNLKVLNGLSNTYVTQILRYAI